MAGHDCCFDVSRYRHVNQLQSSAFNFTGAQYQLRTTRAIPDLESSLVALLWLSCGSLVALLWLSCGSLVALLWLSCGSLVALLWLSCGSLLVALLWLSCGSLVALLWLSCGSLVALLWLSCGSLVALLWLGHTLICRLLKTVLKEITAQRFIGLCCDVS